MNKITVYVVCFMLAIFFSINTTQYNTASAASLDKQTTAKKRIKKRHKRFRLAGCHNLSRSRLNLKAKRFNRNIHQAGRKYNVSPSLIKAVITTESCFRPRARGTSGEKGLMQLMRATGKRFNIRNRYNPKQNIRGGTKYLSYLLKRYGGSTRHAVAAYNTGEGRIRKNGYIPNKSYVYKVMSAYYKFSGSRSKARYYGRSKQKKRYRNNRNNRSKSYIVRSGDSLSKISLRYGVSTKKLIRINRLKSPYRLKVGKRIVLAKYYKKRLSRKQRSKLKKTKRKFNRNYKNLRKAKRNKKYQSRKYYKTSQRRKVARKRATLHKLKKSRKKHYYTVRSGDTLYSVMRKTGVPLKRLMRMNNIKKASTLRVKQKLKIK